MNVVGDFEKVRQDWQKVGLKPDAARATVVAMTSDAADTHAGINTHEIVRNAEAFVAQYTGILPDDIVEVLRDPSSGDDVRRYAAGLAFAHLGSLLRGEQPLEAKFTDEFA